MNDIYNTLAEGYEKLAAGFRALAEQDKAPDAEPEKPAESPDTPGKAPRKGGKKLTDVQLRAAMRSKMEAGRTQEIKELLMKYGVSKLGDLNHDNYEAFFAEVEAL